MKEEVNSTTHFIGIGDFGINALAYIQKKDPKATYTSISSPEKLIVKSEIINSKYEPFYYEKRDKEHSILSAEIKANFTLNSKYIILAQLDVYEETKMVKELFYYLQSENKQFMIICSMPLSFNFESRHKIEFANSIKMELEKYPLHFKFLYLKPLQEKFGQLKINDFFEKVDEQFYSVLKEIR